MSADEDHEDGDEDWRYLKNVRVRPVTQNSSRDISSEIVQILQNSPPNLSISLAIKKMFPYAVENHPWIVDRISVAHLETLERLQALKTKHFGALTKGSCPSAGSYCVALGAASEREDLLSTLPDCEVGSFGQFFNRLPPGFPLPMAHRLPGRFQCQLCYKAIFIETPSQWPRHVYRDIRSYVCTVQKCNHEKPFRQRENWLGHGNECHRHFEWWACQVEYCRYTCDRKDNFLQHLIQAHKHPEPTPNMKERFILDPSHTSSENITSRFLELCRMESFSKPQDQDCKFCGQSFNTWKKIASHTANHLEEISLIVTFMLENRPRSD